MKVTKQIIDQLSKAQSESDGTSLITMYIPGDYTL